MCAERGALAALAALTCLRFLLAACLPLSPDEAYYWIFSTHLQAGYLDAPPMVAVFIRAGTALFGAGAFGIRAAAPLAAALGSVLLWRAGDDLFPAQKPGLAAAALFNATIRLIAGGVVITPDTPLLLFWCAGLAALGRWRASGRGAWWLAVGLAAGCAMEAKYTGLLFAAGTGLWLLATPGVRGALRTPWPWAGLGVALLAEAPNIGWNALHGFVSFAKQGGRVAAFAPAHALGFLEELIGGQLALATPVVLAAAVLALWRLRRDAAPEARLLLWLVLPGAGVFALHTLSGRVQANWPAVLYPAALLAAARVGWGLRAALVSGYALLGLALISLALPRPLAARADPVARQMAGWGALAAEAAARGAGYTTSDDYATLAELAFHAPAGAAVYGHGRRWALLGLPPAPARAGLMLTKHADVCPASAARLARKRGGETIQDYALCPLGPGTGGPGAGGPGAAGPGFVLPHAGGR